MDQSRERLTVVVEGTADTDAVELAKLTQQLRRRLLELDVESVELVRTQDVPVGAKPADVQTIGALVITLAPSALQAVLALAQRWFTTKPVSSIKIAMGEDSLELTGASGTQIDALTQAFLQRHGQQ